MRDPNNITDAKQTTAEEEVADPVKAALLISGADKWRYGRLKEQLANNYLLGTDQYPDTLEKASRSLETIELQRGHPLEGVPLWRSKEHKQRGERLTFIQQGARA